MSSIRYLNQPSYEFSSFQSAEIAYVNFRFYSPVSEMLDIWS